MLHQRYPQEVENRLLIYRNNTFSQHFLEYFLLHGKRCVKLHNLGSHTNQLRRFHVLIFISRSSDFVRKEIQFILKLNFPTQKKAILQE